MAFVDGQGQVHYRACLRAAEQSNSIGVHKHVHTPQQATSRLGFSGKRPSKKALKVLAEKLLQQSINKPELRQAALNMSKYL